MDFRDFQTRETVTSDYAGFLGLERLFGKKNKTSAQTETTYENQLQSRFPFSDMCAVQSELVFNLKEEANRIWSEKSMTRNAARITELENQSVILQAYLDKAKKYMDEVSCPVAPTIIAVGTITPGNDTVLESATVNEPEKPVVLTVPAAVHADPQIIKGVDNKILGFAGAAIVVLAIFKIFKP